MQGLPHDTKQFLDYLPLSSFDRRQTLRQLPFSSSNTQNGLFPKTPSSFYIQKNTTIEAGSHSTRVSPTRHPVPFNPFYTRKSGQVPKQFQQVISDNRGTTPSNKSQLPLPQPPLRIIPANRALALASEYHSNRIFKPQYHSNKGDPILKSLPRHFLPIDNPSQRIEPPQQSKHFLQTDSLQERKQQEDSIVRCVITSSPSIRRGNYIPDGVASNFFCTSVQVCSNSQQKYESQISSSDSINSPVNLSEIQEKFVISEPSSLYIITDRLNEESRQPSDMPLNQPSEIIKKDSINNRLAGQIVNTKKPNSNNNSTYTSLQYKQSFASATNDLPSTSLSPQSYEIKQPPFPLNQHQSNITSAEKSVVAATSKFDKNDFQQTSSTNEETLFPSTSLSRDFFTSNQFLYGKPSETLKENKQKKYRHNRASTYGEATMLEIKSPERRQDGAQREMINEVDQRRNVLQILNQQQQQLIPSNGVHTAKHSSIIGHPEKNSERQESFKKPRRNSEHQFHIDNLTARSNNNNKNKSNNTHSINNTFGATAATRVHHQTLYNPSDTQQLQMQTFQINQMSSIIVSQQRDINEQKLLNEQLQKRLQQYQLKFEDMSKSAKSFDGQQSLIHHHAAMLRKISDDFHKLGSNRKKILDDQACRPNTNLNCNQPSFLNIISKQPNTTADILSQAHQHYQMNLNRDKRSFSIHQNKYTLEESQ